VASDAITPPRPYAFVARMGLRSGDHFELLTTGRVERTVTSASTVDLGDLFVIDPSYVTGVVELAHPALPGGPADGEALQLAARDIGTDGLPIVWRALPTYYSNRWAQSTT